VNEPNNEAVGGKIYPLVAALMWKPGGLLEGYGLKLNPKQGSTHYARLYDALIARLEQYRAPQANETKNPSSAGVSSG
jgi:hypothetical protein